MSRTRDRESAKGLLPRMEARRWLDGKTITYRYHPVGGNPINLGTDKIAALQKVLDLNQSSPDKGTMREYWRLYQESPRFLALAESTKASYRELSVKLLSIVGDVRAVDIRPMHINRYLRVERADAPVVANREFAVWSNLLNLAVERGEIDSNPAKEVRRNPEKPRTEAVPKDTLSAFVAWATALGGQSVVLVRMARFTAYGGSRRMEFLRLTWPQVDRREGVIRLTRGKQRDVIVWDRIEIGEQMALLLDELEADRKGREFVFCNRFGNPYTDSGFKAMWSKLVAKALEKKVIERRFTFHDLRAYYATTHKTERGNLPDMHKNPATTARIYDRNTEIKRGAL